MRRVCTLVLSVFLASCGGDDRGLPASASGKVRAATSAFASMIDSVCDCPNLSIPRDNCEMELRQRIPGGVIESLVCIGDVLDRDPSAVADSIAQFLDCPINALMAMSDCVIAAECDKQKILDCQRLLDRIDACPEPEGVGASAELEARLEACIS